MTRLIDRRRRLVLETPLLIGKRPLVVVVEPWGLALRQKGCHQNLSITWAQVWNRAATSLPSRGGLSAASEVQGRKSVCERRWNIIVSVNKVILVGNLGKNPEVKYLASGAAVCRFSLATNETWKNKAGDVEKRTEWHSVVAFGRLGEVCGEWLTAGRLVYVEGAIRSNQWEDKDGNRRKSYDIVARQMRMLSPSNGNGTKLKESKAAQPSEHSDEDNPFNQDAASDIPY